MSVCNCGVLLLREIKEKIALEVLGLAEGDTIAIHCPACKAVHEKKLFVTKISHTTTAFQCKRATCGISGYIKTGSTNEPELAIQKKSRIKEVNEDNLIPCPENLLTTIENKYQLDLKLHGLKCSADRLYLPLHTRMGYVWGYEAKAIDRERTPKKTIVLQTEEAPTLDYHIQNTTDTVVLVEDWYSAEKYRQAGVSAVNLQGTHLSKENALSLAHTTKTLILSLDPDAIKAAIKIKKDYGILFRRVEILVLKQDPKDTDINHLIELANLWKNKY